MTPGEIRRIELEKAHRKAINQTYLFDEFIRNTKPVLDQYELSSRLFSTGHILGVIPENVVPVQYRSQLIEDLDLCYNEQLEITQVWESDTFNFGFKYHDLTVNVYLAPNSMCTIVEDRTASFQFNKVICV